MLAGARGGSGAITSATPATSCCGSPRPTTCPAAGFALGPQPPGLAHQCSAMAEAHLNPKDHRHPAGGIDLQFRTTKTKGGDDAMRRRRPGVRALVDTHNGMLNFGGAKMSKSVAATSEFASTTWCRPSAGSLALCPAVRPLPAAAGMVGRADRAVGAHPGPAVRALRDLAGNVKAEPIPASIEAAAGRSEHAGGARRNRAHRRRSAQGGIEQGKGRVGRSSWAQASRWASRRHVG